MIKKKLLILNLEKLLFEINLIGYLTIGGIEFLKQIKILERLLLKILS
jgi:hypothetical protein